MNTEIAGRANPQLKAKAIMTARDDQTFANASDDPVGDILASQSDPDSQSSADRQDIIDRIRFEYRLAKAAEQSRIRIDLGLYAFARVYFSAWQPSAEKVSRLKAAAQAKRVVDQIRAGTAPSEEDSAIYAAMSGMVNTAQASWHAFEVERKAHRKAAEKMVAQLPAWDRIKHVRGFSVWGLATIVGEVGDVGDYPGPRHLFKRLGLAPDECYPKGEQRTGRMIPRNSRGRIMGIIADPLFRAQWRGAREGDDGSQRGNESQVDFDPVATSIPAHAIGPFGAVYGEAKVRQLAAGKTKGHAEKLARRTMVKALLHDVHRAWHGVELDYAKQNAGDGVPAPL